MGCILVTGATGNVGREVVNRLRKNGSRVRAMSRNPQSADFPGDIEVEYGDLSAPQTLDGCLDGVDTVFLVWVAPFEAAAPAIQRLARHAARIVFLSSPHRTQHPFFQQPNRLRLVHAGIEELIEASGMQWTFLRPGAFALNSRNWWAPQIRAADVVRWCYADAATAPIDERDIAAVAVHALCNDAQGGKDYVLTGPESITQREQVHIIGEVIGRRLSYEELSRESARQAMLTMMPAPAADMLLSAYAAAVGHPAFVTPTVAQVTGGRAATFREWVRDHATEFT